MDIITAIDRQLQRLYQIYTETGYILYEEYIQECRPLINELLRISNSSEPPRQQPKQTDSVSD